MEDYEDDLMAWEEDRVFEDLMTERAEDAHLEAAFEDRF